MRALTLIFTIMLTLCAGGVLAQDDVPPGRIAFASDRSGIYQIYTANADGSDVERITDGTYAAYLPLWTPDGAHLLYLESTSDAPLSEHPVVRLMLADADGSNAVEITRDPEDGFIMNPYQYLSFSPDGRYLVYTLFTESTGQQVQHFLAKVATGESVAAADPTLAPNVSFAHFLTGDMLVFSSSGTVTRAGLHGENTLVLAEDAGSPAVPSPDGTRIAYVDGGDLIVMSADGSGREIIVADMPGPAEGGMPLFANSLQWSPDGAWISGAVRLVPPAGSSAPTDALFTVRADGSDYTAFTAGDHTLSWSPDSAFITYTLTQDGVTQVAVARPDTSEQRIISGDGSSAQAAWQPG